ncbi:MAG: pyrimidine reductase family protein [Microbacteriaceae bacterium]
MSIDRLWPDAAAALDDEELVAGLRQPGDVLRVNFISSADGAGTRDGLSGGLGDASDRRCFELLRRVADVVLVGAGTVRAEGYGPLRVSDASAAWREEHGLTSHPTLAVVSGSLGLDPGSRVLAEAPVRPLLVTTAGHDVAAFAPVADVIEAGTGARVDAVAALRALRGRGLRDILCEGGPRLFGALLEADAVDELCLTLAPSLEAGDAGRIATGPLPRPRGLELAQVLRGGSTLLLRYRRAGR